MPPSRRKTTNTAVTADEQNNINEGTTGIVVVGGIGNQLPLSNYVTRQEIIPMQDQLNILRSSIFQANVTTMNMFTYIEQQITNFGQRTIQLSSNIDEIHQQFEQMRISGVTQNSDISIIGDPNFFDVVFEKNGNNDPDMA